MMTEGSGEVEDELIDLNKEPVERKRKRVEKSNSADKGNEGSDGLPKTGRVLRSRTVAMSDGEKQVIKMEIVKMEDGDGNQVPVMEHKDESEVPVLHKTKKKGKRGRPRKTEVKCEVSSLSPRKKGKRGRPPKLGGKCQVASLGNRKEGERVDESSNGTGRGRGRPKVKGKRGRPRKIQNENMGLAIKKKIVKRNSDHKKIANGGPVKILKVDSDDLENGVTRQKKGTVEPAEGKEMGLREQKQLVRDQLVAKVGTNDLGDGVMRQKKRTVVSGKGKEMGLREQKQLLRDQIVAMLMKAGWTVEYRERISREYQDAVYVDREGRGYWSVTLAYKKFKERIDKGTASEQDILAFTPIPDETLGILFRVTVKGRKAGKKKNGAGRTIKTKTKKESSKSNSNGRIKPRLNRGSQRTLLARRPRDGSDGDNNELYEEKRTLLSWMIDLGTVPLGGKVKYKRGRGRGRKILLEGRIVKEGICCDCCNITHRIRDFESHAESTPGKPYENIYLDSGISLFQCLVDSWKKHAENDSIGFVCVDVEGDDPNDDTCNVCGDGVHVHCIKETVAEDFDNGNRPFCGKECFEIFEQLQVLLGVKHELEEGFSYTILQHCAVSGDASLNGDSSKVLSSLGVEKLVIPAISELNETWTKIFGFHPLEESKRQEMRYMSMIAFPGKLLPIFALISKYKIVVKLLKLNLMTIHMMPRLLSPNLMAIHMMPTLLSPNLMTIHMMPWLLSPNLMTIHMMPKSDDNTYDAPATESTEVQTHHQNTQEEQGEDNGGIATSNCDISPKIEINNNDKVAVVESGASMPVSSLNETDIKNVNVGESSENGDCINDLDSSKDNDISLETNTTVDCNLETKQQSAEETDTCPNRFLLENEKTGNCGGDDISEGNASGRET
ncbi:hypothetical protein DH2020_007110 [Rehmannia glutinosa]|uniref:Zinc finger PHD-type domain-containing protein n=1 Tax=Rehmannia glutinosa TaxID=99300 RepID=A0ABR0TXM8_REHGL